MSGQYKQKKEGATRHMMKKKAAIALFIAFILAVILIVKIVSINVVNGENYSQIVLDHQAYDSNRVEAKRGEITDRNGTVLAYSKKVYNVMIDPQRMSLDPEKYRTPAIAALTECFGLSESEIIDAINENTESRYKKLLSQKTEEEVAAFNEKLENDMDLAAAVWLEDDYVRSYPFGSLACDVIGFSSSVNGGEIGLEKQYDTELTGTDGLFYSYIDEGLTINKTMKKSEAGNTIVTTLDYGVQNILEENLSAYLKDRPAKNAAAIVMDPNSGEILGMCSYPNFDLNNPRDLSSVYTSEELAKMNDTEKVNAMYSLWNNFCTSQVYEPGSTFKSVTVSAALEEGVIEDGDTFDCGGSLQVDDYDIGCWTVDQGGHGTIELEEALGDSCNVALMQIAFKLGAQKLSLYQTAFGFGSRTGIDLPGEERGIVMDPDTMEDVDLATNSFGQSINVNAVQMIAAYGSIVNGGYYYKPHIVKEIVNDTGDTVKTISPTVIRQTITKSTSDLIRSYLEAGVEKYCVQYSKVEGYSMGGKTATAEKIPRTDKKWVISVMSFAPVDNPKFLLYVVLDEAYGTTGGSGDGTDSQVVTKSIMEDLLPYMGIPNTGDVSVSDSEGSGETGVDVPEYEVTETVEAIGEEEEEEEEEDQDIERKEDEEE